MNSCVLAILTVSLVIVDESPARLYEQEWSHELKDRCTLRISFTCDARSADSDKSVDWLATFNLIADGKTTELCRIQSMEKLVNIPDVERAIGESKVTISLDKKRCAAITAVPTGGTSSWIQLADLPLEIGDRANVRVLKSTQREIQDAARDVLLEAFDPSDGVSFVDERGKDLWTIRLGFGRPTFSKFRCLKDGDLEIWSVKITAGKEATGEFRRRVGYRGWWEADRKK